MPWIYLAMATAAVGAIASIVGIYFMAGALNAVLTGNTTAVLGLSFNLWQLLILIAVLIIVSFLCRKGSFVTSHLGAFRLEQIFRTRLSDHLAKLPLGFITNTGSGTLKKVLVDDVNMLHAFVTDSTPFIGKSLAGADNILVVENGKIAEQGDHTKLMTLNKRYASMWHAQQRIKKWNISAVNSSK